jgi:hypothetical protein
MGATALDSALFERSRDDVREWQRSGCCELAGPFRFAQARPRRSLGPLDGGLARATARGWQSAPATRWPPRANGSLLHVTLSHCQRRHVLEADRNAPVIPEHVLER